MDTPAVNVSTYYELAAAFAYPDTAELKPVYAYPFHVEACTGFSILFYKQCMLAIALRGNVFIKPMDVTFSSDTLFSSERRIASYVDDFLYNWKTWLPGTLGDPIYDRQRFKEAVGEVGVLRDILRG